MKLSTKICAAMAPLGLLLALVSPGALATASVCDAVAGNLVANCGFENGNSSWSITTPPTAMSFVTDFGAHSGNYGVEFGAGHDSLAQAIATTIGDTYTVTFWWADTQGNNYASFGGTFGTHSLVPNASTNNAQPVLYTEYTLAGLSVVSSNTTLTMFGDVPFGEIYLDDFSVVDTTGSVTPTPPSTSVPEPASAPLFGLGLAGIGFMLMMRRRRHQGDGMTESE